MEKYRVFAAIVTHTYISVDDFGGKLYELDKMTYTIGNFGQFCINAYLKICRNREIENDLIQAKSQKSPLCTVDYLGQRTGEGTPNLRDNQTSVDPTNWTNTHNQKRRHNSSGS